MTIARLPGTKLTPRLLLAQVLEDIDDCESIVIVETHADGSTKACWSNQKIRDVAFAGLYLQHMAMDGEGVIDETEERL